MTIRELYSEIGGDYEQAMKVLRIEKLLDKHIRKLPDNNIFSSVSEAKQSMDPTALFESAHAIKGVCSNLGLINMASIASDISEEFRPGNSRCMTDDEVKAKIDMLEELFNNAVVKIKEYSN